MLVVYVVYKKHKKVPCNAIFPMSSKTCFLKTSKYERALTCVCVCVRLRSAYRCACMPTHLHPNVFQEFFPYADESGWKRSRKIIGNGRAQSSIRRPARRQNRLQLNNLIGLKAGYSCQNWCALCDPSNAAVSLAGSIRGQATQPWWRSETEYWFITRTGNYIGRHIVYIDGDRFVGDDPLYHFHTRHLAFGRPFKVAGDKMGQADVMKMEYIVSFDHFDSFGKMLTICILWFSFWRICSCFSSCSKVSHALKTIAAHTYCCASPKLRYLNWDKIAVFVSTVLLLRVGKVAVEQQFA